MSSGELKRGELVVKINYIEAAEILKEAKKAAADLITFCNDLERNLEGAAVERNNPSMDTVN